MFQHSKCITCSKEIKSKEIKSKEIKNSHNICKNCYKEMLLANNHKAHNIYTIYYYQGISRKLILSAKANNHYGALMLLCQLFAENEITQQLAQWAHTIIPAPSSLWGRLRGRFDIAYHLAHTISNNKQLQYCPWKLYWQRIKKRSQNTTRNKYYHLPLNHNKKNTHKILLIDDVITTGYTLHTLAYALQQKHRNIITFKALSFARTKKAKPT